MLIDQEVTWPLEFEVSLRVVRKSNEKQLCHRWTKNDFR